MTAAKPKRERGISVSRGIVLSLCDRTGNMARPWGEAGFTCLCIDTQHPSDGTRIGPNTTGIGADVRTFAGRELRPAIVFAFPPCTHLAFSGARWFKQKGLRCLIDSLELVEACRVICESSDCPWMLENPMGTLATYWRKPDLLFDPCDFGGYLTPPGDAYTKRTCLWVGGGFVAPDPKPVFPIEGSKMHRVPPGGDRANIRSETPMGFARAVYEANSGKLQKANA